MKLFRFIIAIPGLSTDEAVETVIFRAESWEMAMEMAVQVLDIDRSLPAGGCVGSGKRQFQPWTADELIPDGDNDALWPRYRPGHGIV